MWKKRDRRRAAQDTLPTAELPAGMLPVPTAGETAARSSSTLGTRARRDPAARAAQLRFLLTSLKITGLVAHGQMLNVTFMLIFKLGHECLFFRECSRKLLPSAQMGTAKI